MNLADIKQLPIDVQVSLLWDYVLGKTPLFTREQVSSDDAIASFMYSPAGLEEYDEAIKALARGNKKQLEVYTRKTNGRVPDRQRKKLSIPGGQ